MPAQCRAADRNTFPAGVAGKQPMLVAILVSHCVNNVTSWFIEEPPREHKQICASFAFLFNNQ